MSRNQPNRASALIVVVPRSLEVSGRARANARPAARIACLAMFTPTPIVSILGPLAERRLNDHTHGFSCTVACTSPRRAERDCFSCTSTWNSVRFGPSTRQYAPGTPLSELEWNSPVGATLSRPSGRAVARTTLGIACMVTCLFVETGRDKPVPYGGARQRRQFRRNMAPCHTRARYPQSLTRRFDRGGSVEWDDGYTPGASCRGRPDPVPHPGRRRARRERHRLRARRGRGPWRGRRERLGQERDHAVAPPAVAHAAGGDRLGVREAGGRGPDDARRGSAPGGAGCPGGLHLPGSDDVAEPRAHRGLPVDGAAAPPSRHGQGRPPANAPRSCWTWWASPRRLGASATFRTSSRGACGNA